MRSAIFITVRSDSSRLPRQGFPANSRKPPIEMVMLRAKLVKKAGTVIVCTTERTIDDRIVQIASNCSVSFAR